MNFTHHREHSLAVGIAVWQAKKSNIDTGQTGETNSTHRSLQRHDAQPDAVGDEADRPSSTVQMTLSSMS